MRFRNMFIVVTAILMLFMSAFAAEARCRGPYFKDKGMGPDMRGLRVLLELKLTDSQRMQIMDILDKYWKDREEVGCSVAENRRELRRLLEEEQFNEERARKGFRKAYEERRNYQFREDMFVAKAKLMAQIKKVLTPEQQEILKKLGPRHVKRARPY